MNEAERRAASEKYYQKLRAELDERIRGDKQLRKIAEKIANKTANFNDTAKYSEIVSNYIGTVLQENVGDISSPLAKEYVCKELLKDQHSAINELFESVQVSIDEQNGIHIKTQKPKFPEERVDKVAHALEDPTVPLKTIKRRANAPVANVSKSFHDDCVKKNAQFRHDAGLKCYIIRIGTKCCEWCTEVAGKYRFGEQPDGIFRRHDNCDCTIIYDGQVLRGKQNADGSRSKTWEELPNANAADYTTPTLSEAEGRAIEQRNLAQIRGLKINNSSIDNSNTRDIIKLRINLFDKADPIYIDAFSIEPEPGYEDVMLHGSPSSVQIIKNGKPQNLSAQEFATVLKQNGYKGGNIRLASCETGKGNNSFAQQLSETLGVKVKAPDDDVYFIPDEGIMFVGSEFSNTGSWRIFEKGVEIFE